MSRSWYVSPVRVRPGFYIPGRYDPSDGYWMGPRPSNEFCKGDMEKVRGPFPNVKEAAEAARVWREEDGKHSDIWLCLVEGDYGEVTHCNKYDPDFAARAAVAENFSSLLNPMAEVTPYKIERRPHPGWSPYGPQMVTIPPMSASGKRGIAGTLLDTLQGQTPNTSPGPEFDLGHQYRPVDHGHDYQVGGKCSRCDSWCPHPIFAKDEMGHDSCTTCRCLKPPKGGVDCYELAIGPWQPCMLTSGPKRS